MKPITIEELGWFRRGITWAGVNVPDGKDGLPYGGIQGPLVSLDAVVKFDGPVSHSAAVMDERGRVRSGELYNCWSWTGTTCCCCSNARRQPP